MRSTHLAASLLVLGLGSMPACHSRERDDARATERASDDAAAHAAGDDGTAPSKANRFSLQFEGAELLEFQRRGDVFSITTAGGKAWGTLKLEQDRVKLEQDGKETAKAKAKDYGFKVYDGERELFKVKRKGAGYEVRRADDSELGRFEAQAGRFASDAVTLESAGESSVLKRGDRTLVTVRGPLSSTAALMLAATEATLPQRLVMAGIVQERIAP